MLVGRGTAGVGRDERTADSSAALRNGNAKMSAAKKKAGVTVAGYRRLALSMPGAVEGSHWGNADFRVGGRIFCTTSLVKEGYGVLKLTPEEQAGMVADAPEVFSPVPGGWGEMGATRVRLDAVSEDVLEGAIRVAWRLRLKKAGSSRR